MKLQIKLGMQTMFNRFWRLVFVLSLMFGSLSFISSASAASFSHLYGVDLLNGSGTSVYGSTGLIVSPTAQLVRHGVIAGAFNNYIEPGSPADSQAENYYLTAGVWRGFEVQLGLNELHAKGADPNAYGDSYNRDLVANLKYGMNLSDQFRVAIGGQDVMGLAVQNQRWYGVMTFASRYLATSLGYAVNGSASRRSVRHLEGVFGGAEVYLPYNLSVMMDYDGFEARSGLRARFHNIAGSHLQLNLNAQLYSTQSDEKFNFGLTVSYPLGGDAKARLENLADAESRIDANQDSALPSFHSSEVHASRIEVVPDSDVTNQRMPSEMVPDSEELPQDAHLQLLQHQLYQAGLEHIALKVDTETSSLFCRYQNRLYDLNEQDALAQAIALLAPFAQQHDLVNIEVELLRKQMPVLMVKLGTAWALGQQQKFDSKARYYLPKFELLHSSLQASWQGEVSGGRSEWLSLKLEPYIVSTVGSELGVYQQSLGMLSELSAPLWAGASAHLSRIDPLHNSYHFKPGGFLENERVISQWKELSFSQAWVPFDGLVNIFSYQMALNQGEKTDHIINSTRYYFDEGRHQLYGNWSRHTRNVPLATTGLNTWSGDYYGYEFYWPEQGMGAYIERGIYLNQDLTTKLAFKSYLGDSQLQATLMRTDRGYEKVRLNLMIPFTSRRAADFGLLSVRGESKWSYGIETITSDPDNTGVNLNLGDRRYVNFGAEAKQPVVLDQHFMDSGRLNPAYMSTHIHQLNQRVKRILYQQ